MVKVLIVDDEPRIRELIRQHLEHAGYECEEAGDGSAALVALEKNGADLVILDIMMPGKDGFAVCDELRRKSSVPIIFLTARTTEEDYVKGLSLGSDDYFTKPFSTAALVMRVKAIFRRIELEKSSHSMEVVTFGDLTFNMGEKAVFCHGQNMSLTLTEIAFLNYLINHPRAVSRDEMLKEIWGFEGAVETRVTDDTVKRLRKKLVQHKSNVAIDTVWGYGFILKAND